MNLSSIVGILTGFVLIVISITIGGDITRYFDAAGVLIVIGGVLCATMVAYSFEQLKRAVPKAKEAFVKPQMDLAGEAERIVEMAGVARREGLLAMDGQDMGDPFLQKGMELIIDGTDPELVKTVLESEAAKTDEEDQLAVKVLSSMSAFSPAFGMVGTLIGLINMLMFLSDTASLGPSMATALITTFYGVIMANLLFTPLSNKLKSIAADRQNRLEMLTEGILAIQDGENPRIIKEKLSAYYPEQPEKLVESSDQETDSGVPNEKEAIPG